MIAMLDLDAHERYGCPGRSGSLHWWYTMGRLQLLSV